MSLDPAKDEFATSSDHAPAARQASHALAARAPGHGSTRQLRTIVAKVGGSLLDWPELSDRLPRWLAALGTPRVVLVVGGGPAADLVRRRDQWDELGDSKAHWLAVRAMSFNSFLIEGLLDHARVVTSLLQCECRWEQGIVPIVDAHTFMVDDAAGGSPLPQRWSVTSDSIAARVARALDADELVLLKSVAWPDGDIVEAARHGVVDEHLPRELEHTPRLKVRIENLRDDAPPCQTSSNQAGNSSANERS
jgi:aspartokinase-like uncharacterized kinase